MNAQIAGMDIATPAANQRHLADKRESPTRMARSADSHREALRKLGTAVHVAVGNGATWDEIFEVVKAAAVNAAEEGKPGASLAATFRASVHDGDDRF
jgi:hypothetical protein